MKILTENALKFFAFYEVFCWDRRKLLEIQTKIFIKIFTYSKR